MRKLKRTTINLGKYRIIFDEVNQKIRIYDFVIVDKLLKKRLIFPLKYVKIKDMKRSKKKKRY